MRRALLGFWLIAATGACGGSAAAPDGGGGDMHADQTAGAPTLTGTFTPTSGDPCIMTPIKGAPSAPQCTVTEHRTGDGGAVIDMVIPWCDAVGEVAPCWAMGSAIGAGCAYSTFFFNSAPSAGPDPSLSYSYSCVPCPPGSPASGC